MSAFLPAKLAAAAVLLCTSVAVLANSDNGVQTIVTTEIHDSGNVFVTFNGGNNTEVCGGTTGGRTLVISKTNPNFKMLYAAALAAQLSGHQADAWANGCVDIWGNGLNLAPQLTVFTVQ